MKAILWEASDGTRFENELRCLNYEKSLLHCWDADGAMITGNEDILRSAAAFMIIQKQNVEKANRISRESKELPDGGFSEGIWYFSNDRWYKLEDSEQFV